MAFKQLPEAIVCGLQPFKPLCALGALVQMIEQRLKPLFVAARTPGIHLCSV